MSMALIVSVEGRRRDVEAAPPDEDLVFPVLRCGLSLVEPLETSVVTLIKLPSSGHWKPCLVELFEDEPHGADRSLQDRGVDAVELDSSIAQLYTASARLFFTAL